MKAVVAGFGLHCSPELLQLASELGTACNLYSVHLFAGGYQGVFESALLCNKLNSLILEEERLHLVPKGFPAEIIATKTTTQKHQLLAQKADCVFVLGGGKGTLKVVDAFQKLKKSIYVFVGSGGCAEQLKGEKIIQSSASAEEIVKLALAHKK